MNSKPSPSTCSRQRIQSGFTLIEIMVAVTIGLFIVLALTGVFINMKSAFTTQDKLSELQDNERLVLTVLTTTIESAGYFPDPLLSTAAANLPLGGAFTVDGQGIVGTTGTAPASDTLTTQYRSASGDGLVDCLGQTNTSGSKATFTNVFSVSANNELMCAASGGTPTALVSNVSAFSVLYGTDTSASGNADRYLTASAVTSGGLWAQVRTARITIKFLNPFAGQPGQTSSTIDVVQTVNLMNKS
jgi:type IV pilus assembly protein PilW